MSDISDLNLLITNIKEALKDDPERFRTLRLLLNRFKRSPNNPSLVLSQIKSILSDNQSICDQIDDVCSKFPTDDCNLSIHLSNFILETNKVSANSKLGFIISEVLSFYSEELICISFLHYYTSLLISDLSKEQQIEIQSKVHYLAQEIDINRTKLTQLNSSPNYLINAIPLDVDMEHIFSIPQLLQFLVMINLLISIPDSIYSILKCLKMYSSQVISNSEAVEWVTQFDAVLGIYFHNLIIKNEPIAFNPLNIKAMIEDHIPSEQIRTWAVGDIILNYIKRSSRDEMSFSKMQFSAKNDSQEPNESFQNQKDTFLPQSLLTMKTYTYFDEIENFVKKIKNKEPVKIQPKIINSIYGNENFFRGPKDISANNNSSSNPNKHSNFIGNNHTYYIEYENGLILRRCKKLCGENIYQQIRFVNEAMENLDSFGNEWRIYYTSLMKPKLIKEMLIVQGFHAEKCQKMEVANSILINFLGKFTRTNFPENFIQKFFTECFSEGSHYCGVNSALCLYYYYSILNSIETYSGDCNLNSIPEVVFQSMVPMTAYDNPFIANIDIPLKHFARNATKLKSDEIVCSNDISVILEFDETFFFEICVKADGSMDLIPSANPTIKIPNIDSSPEA